MLSIELKYELIARNRTNYKREQAVFEVQYT